MGFCSRRLVHPNYCLVCLDVRPDEAASFIRPFLRHREFDAVRKRMGSVVRVSHVGLRAWALRKEAEAVFAWPG